MQAKEMEVQAKEMEVQAKEMEVQQLSEEVPPCHLLTLLRPRFDAGIRYSSHGCRLG